MRLVNELKQGLIASHRTGYTSKELGIAIKVSGGIGNPHVGQPYPDSIEGTFGGKADNEFETPFSVTDGGR